MLSEIIGIISQYIILYNFHLFITMRIRPCLNGFRHTADNIVIFQILLKRNRIKFRYLPVKWQSFHPFQILFTAVRHHELFKTHRMHFNPVYLSNRKRYAFFSQRHAQKRTSGDQMQIRHIFTEVLQRLDRPRAILYLVKHHQRGAGMDLLAVNDAPEFIHDPFDVKIICKYRVQTIVSVKIKVSRFFKFLFTERLDQIGLAALTYPRNKQRLSVLLILPGNEFFKYGSFHTRHPP